MVSRIVAKRSAQCISKISTRTCTTNAIIKPALVSNHTPNSYSRSNFHTSTMIQSSKVDQAFDKILQLDLVEVHLLTELVNEKMGISPLSDAQRAAMQAGGGGKGGAAAATEEVEEKTAFDLKLTGFDAKSKIKVIKEIRGITGLGLKEAKEMVEGAPKVVKKEIKMEEAEELKAKLEAVGATCEIA